MEVSAVGGTVVLFWNASGDRLPDLPSPLRLMGRNAAVAGFNISGVAARRPAALRQAMTQLLDWMAAGRLDLPVQVLDALEAVPRVHDRLAGGMSRGKHVVRPGGSRHGRLESTRSEVTAD
jgi:NADPH-dependent curcumin reductase CurA